MVQAQRKDEIVSASSRQRHGPPRCQDDRGIAVLMYVDKGSWEVEHLAKISEGVVIQVLTYFSMLDLCQRQTGWGLDEVLRRH